MLRMWSRSAELSAVKTENVETNSGAGDDSLKRFVVANPGLEV